jgi:hypothetical protein
MIAYEDYVAGWISSSIHEFLKIVPASAASMRYTLVTCLDSELRPRDFFENGGGGVELVAREAIPVGDGLVIPTKRLLAAESEHQMFFGFDELWFFPSSDIQPKPRSAWLVGPERINQAKLDQLGAWMLRNSCALALGDGEGLNFVTKARGLVKHVLAHTMEQPRPFADAGTAPSRRVAV